MVICGSSLCYHREPCDQKHRGTPNLMCSNGRTPEEEWLYRAEHRLPLRTTPPTREEQRRWIREIQEEDSGLMQRLADA